MTIYCFKAYFKSRLTFGKSSEVTCDVIQIWREFLAILNEDTITYYYEVLDDIEIASETGREWSAKRKKKDFDTLIESSKYQRQLCSLFLNFEDIQTFLSFPIEFWEFISSRRILIDPDDVDILAFSGVVMKTEQDILIDIKVFVPEIRDLQTALINIHEYNYAYGLYLVLGQKLEIANEEYERKAKEKEALFQESFLPLKWGSLTRKMSKK